jgi:hypothetical protein
MQTAACKHGGTLPSGCWVGGVTVLAFDNSTKPPWSILFLALVWFGEQSEVPVAAVTALPIAIY